MEYRPLSLDFENIALTVFKEVLPFATVATLERPDRDRLEIRATMNLSDGRTFAVNELIDRGLLERLRSSRDAVDLFEHLARQMAGKIKAKAPKEYDDATMGELTMTPHGPVVGRGVKTVSYEPDYGASPDDKVVTYDHEGMTHVTLPTNFDRFTTHKEKPKATPTPKPAPPKKEQPAEWGTW